MAPLAVAYILKMYPRFSETFILNEVLAVEGSGILPVGFQIDDTLVHEGEHRILGIDAGTAEHAPDRDRSEGGEQFADIVGRHRRCAPTAASRPPA